jgi:hypothetical protein
MIKVDHKQRKRSMETAYYPDLNILNHIINDYNNGENSSSFEIQTSNFDRIKKIIRNLNKNGIFGTMFVKDKKFDALLRVSEFFDFMSGELRLFDDDLKLHLFNNNFEYTPESIRWTFGENLEIENATFEFK